MWGTCPDISFTYNKDSSIFYHTPGVMDGGIVVQGKIAPDGYFYVSLAEITFGGDRDKDIIRFKPVLNKSYKVYMDPRIDNRIYVDTTYERLQYSIADKDYVVLETCEG